jgi:branched-subunit amino acid ABC-type transport system permease component
MKKLLKKILEFFKKYGIDAVLALAIFNFPMYGIFFITNANFRTFAAAYTAFFWGLGPLTPGWLLTILLAVFIRWLRMGAWQLILLAQEAMRKLQLQNQLAAYLTSEEINMILEMAKRVESASEKERQQFKDALRKQRLKMIDDQWTKEVENQ